MNSSLSQVNSIAMPNPGAVYHFDAFGIYLVYAYGSTVVMNKCTTVANVTKMYTITTPATVDDVRVRYPYLIIATNDTVIYYER